MDKMRFHPFLHFQWLNAIELVERACATETLNKSEFPWALVTVHPVAQP